jgi:hypothetical protein
MNSLERTVTRPSNQLGDQPGEASVDQQIDETIAGLLGRIMDGTCRPLKVRIETRFIVQTQSAERYNLVEN